eukprot:TRINITY_DN49123_c0_g1_i1.p1 TRINITY_DN49123_c0_g1~~TRINITY_DN49123_c0_g1_i1.p1  ORF type:complete len:236 (-),score=35.79 TRINITY_DN49123_c0_g1_i1:185-838(-)
MAAPPSSVLFIGDLPGTIDEGTCEKVFGAYGTLQRCKLLQLSPSGNRAAILEFESADEAKWIVENVNGNIPQGLDSPVIVRYKHVGNSKGGSVRSEPYGKSQSTQQRTGKGTTIAELVNAICDSNALPGGSKYSNDENTIFVSGLPKDTKDDHLYSIFTPFGAIAPRGVRAMLDNQQSCKGFGFVNFLDPKAAALAISTLNGTTLPCGTVMQVKIKK